MTSCWRDEAQTQKLKEMESEELVGEGDQRGRVKEKRYLKFLFAHTNVPCLTVGIFQIEVTVQFEQRLQHSHTYTCESVAFLNCEAYVRTVLRLIS